MALVAVVVIAVVLALALVAAFHVVISAGRYVYWCVPCIEEAEASLRNYKGCIRHVLPSRKSKGVHSVRNTRKTSWRLIIIIAMSFPAYVDGMNSSYSARMPTHASVVGVGIAGTAVVAVTADGCIQKQRCNRRDRNRLIAEQKLKKRCEDSGQIYIPAPENESDRDRRNRRRFMTLKCESPGEREFRLKQRRAKRKAETSEAAVERKHCNAENMKKVRKAETPDEAAARKHGNAERMRSVRLTETLDEVAARKHGNAERMREVRRMETPDEAAARKHGNAEHMRSVRLTETPDEAAVRKHGNAEHMREVRRTETPDEAAARKHGNAEHMREVRRTETPDEAAARKHGNAEHMREVRRTETPDEAAARKHGNAEHMREVRRIETPVQAAQRKRGIVEIMRASREAESPQEADERRQKDRNRKMERNNMQTLKQQNPDDDFFIGGEIPFIEVSQKGAKRAQELLLRTATGDDGQYHRALGCVVCDEHIIGVEDVHYITKNQLLEHKDRLGVESYEGFHGVLDEELKKQYFSTFAQWEACPVHFASTLIRHHTSPATLLSSHILHRGRQDEELYFHYNPHRREWIHMLCELIS